MLRPTLCALILALTPLVPAASAAAGGPAPAHYGVASTSRHVRISMWLTHPRRVYPRGALAPVTVRLRNLAPFIQVWALDCGNENPQVQVLTPQGTVRYPPALPLLAPLHCLPGAAITRPLNPGATYQRQFLVIMRGRFLRASWDYRSASPQYAANRLTRVTTPPLAVKLVAGRAPAVTLHRAPSVFATIQRPRGSRGPLRFLEVASCPGTKGGPPRLIQNIFHWQPVAGREIRPPCANPTVWHAVAGWVNLQMATVNYVRAKAG
ncbi:MAG: hypothetical protein ACRDFX_00160 [Chloroflexota bacterium]